MVVESSCFYKTVLLKLHEVEVCPRGQVCGLFYIIKKPISQVYLKIVRWEVLGSLCQQHQF